MSIVFETAEGPVEFADALVYAIARRAEFVAALTAETIRKGLELPEPRDGHVHQLNVPAFFLVELGAVLVLHMWERNGITAHLDAGLPSWSDADAELSRRLHDDRSQFERIESVTLNGRVLRFWAENFVWDGIETFGADVMLSTSDEDALVDAVARFIFENRNALKVSLPAEENHQ